VQFYNIPSDEVAAGQFYTKIFMTGVDTTDIISETLYYEIRNECRNPIMLDWVAIGGGVDQHLFTISQAVELVSGEGVVVEKPISEDYATVVRTKRRFPSSAVQRITLVDEHLTNNQLTALAEMKQTSSLRVYLTKDGSEFVDAVVTDNFVTAYDTDNELYTFAVTIEFPDDYDFFAAKKY